MSQIAKEEKKKKVSHKHSWHFDYEDCCRCGGGEVATCGCGEVAEVEYVGKSRRRKMKTISL